MSVNQAVLEKLQKILRLAACKGASQGEVEAAMARAKEIAIQNNIELATVDFTDPNSKAKGMDIAKDGDLKLGTAFYRKYHTWVFHVIKKVFGVEVVTNRYRDGSRERCNQIWIIGEVTDVVIAKAVFTWLEELYPKSYRQAVNSFLIPEDNAASQHGYYRGLSQGILEANRREEEKVQHSSVGQQWAMVIRNKEQAVQQRMAKEFPDLKYSRARAQNVNGSAAALGYAKGKSINLNQVGSGRSAAGHLN